MKKPKKIYQYYKNKEMISALYWLEKIGTFKFLTLSIKNLILYKLYWLKEKCTQLRKKWK